MKLLDFHIQFYEIADTYFPIMNGYGRVGLYCVEKSGGKNTTERYFEKKIMSFDYLD